MLIVKGIDSFASLNVEATTITVGSFDGVHSGHSYLLELLRDRAQAEGRKSVVVSFDPHPRIALGRAQGLSVLTSEIEKSELLKAKGIDYLLLIEFNKEFSALSYEEFIVGYLIERANMRELIMGFNHHMGHNAGDYNSIVQSTNKYGLKVTLSDEFCAEGDKISSTAIRRAISDGDLKKANKLLAHPYLMIGWCNSEGVARSSEPLKLIPPSGLYLADVNSNRQNISITADQRILCQVRDQEVKIEFIEKL